MLEQTSACATPTESGRRRGVHTMLASLAAIGSVVAASSCCWPLLPFVAAAGFAGSSTLVSATRPYLLGVSMLFIAYGFFQARRAKVCGRRPSVGASWLLWISTAIVVMAVFFPQVMANAVASLLAR
jgi:hypothetical protein